MRKMTWETAEQDLRDALGLDSTPGSGNQWNAPGDAVDHRHYLDTATAFIADTKSTKHKSYSLKESFLKEWTEKAMEMGKTFLLHIQFQDHDKNKKTDWVLCSLADFSEISSGDRKTHDQSEAIVRLEKLMSSFKDEDAREEWLETLRLAVGN